ncbi:peptide deformylase [Enterovibrio nigricans]|uniref:Peptide deformylase n=1 Tax=Enterovibrio nigricans DSM 22720 TaxID=1121868 RepID=A0A1T4V6X4_9GAMM|nr:peptide deformylase [Enterovibrio nigricans]PKF50349.1 peptide deformylase [Enterovibrio nigricans]SKA60719.1 peptide deformylase [Enterovibrio nigricans DSM 22720]
MAVLDILTASNPKLKRRAEKVTDFDAVQPLVDDLLETLYTTSNGVGLAAMQVGRLEAVVVIDISEERDQPLVLVNPVVEQGQEKVMGQEGCLSVPDYYADVERFSSVVVSAQDRNGNPITIESDDFLAIVMQHEIDHLNGTLFIDHLSSLKRQMAMKKVKKYEKEFAAQ